MDIYVCLYKVYVYVSMYIYMDIYVYIYNIYVSFTNWAEANVRNIGWEEAMFILGVYMYGTRIL